MRGINCPFSDRFFGLGSVFQRRSTIETLLVFSIFFIQGAWPVPDVNEPYYLGKAVHFWNPDWVQDDTFLNSVGTHRVFYYTFGWLSLWLPLPALAWTGRLLTWIPMAWAWQRLSFSLMPRRWISVLSAALFVCFLERCHMAGEWVVGGVEAKGFAYVFVFLGLESLVRHRWNRAWLWLGAASAFHVLVGGWSVVAAGFTWLCLGRTRPPLKSIAWGLAGGALLSLPGVIPALSLTWGVEPKIVDHANQIYVFGRLSHHLVASSFPATFMARFLGLLIVWALFEFLAPEDDRSRLLRMFTCGILAIATVGLGVDLLSKMGHSFVDRSLAASLLRFYWFRLSDVAIPLAMAMTTVRMVIMLMSKRPRWGRTVLALVVMIAVAHVGWRGVWRAVPTPPRADPPHPYFASWCDACQWIDENVPREARFLTPRMSQTFKWYSGHSEVITQKNIPQDARSLVKWWSCLHDVYARRNPLSSDEYWYESLADMDEQRLRYLGRKYNADYILTFRRPRRILDLEYVYWNHFYIIYRLDEHEKS